MVTINQLLGARGEARRVLGFPHTGWVEWSDADALARLEVIRGIHFDRFVLSRAEVGLNFVECTFDQCAFKDLKTDGHFWGAENHWNGCVFEGCDLRGMIAPVNSFKRCRFEGAMIVNFKPHQTLFEGCSFSGGAIEGLKARLISNSQIANREFNDTGGQLVFRDCRFEGIRFRQCCFEGTVFQGCVFIDTEASGCSFEGVVSDAKWWSVQKCDPFTAFLSKALELIRARCGPESAAYREFETYMIDYGAGKTTNKDFSACLYNNRVPYAETQLIIKDLRKLTATFPF